MYNILSTKKCYPHVGLYQDQDQDQDQGQDQGTLSSSSMQNHNDGGKYERGSSSYPPGSATVVIIDYSIENNYFPPNWSILIRHTTYRMRVERSVACSTRFVAFRIIEWHPWRVGYRRRQQTGRLHVRWPGKPIQVSRDDQRSYWHVFNLLHNIELWKQATNTRRRRILLV